MPGRAVRAKEPTAKTGRVAAMRLACAAIHQEGGQASTVEHGALVAQPPNPLALRQSTTLLLLLLLLLTQPLQQQQVRLRAEGAAPLQAQNTSVHAARSMTAQGFCSSCFTDAELQGSLAKARKCASACDSALRSRLHCRRP